MSEAKTGSGVVSIVWLISAIIYLVHPGGLPEWAYTISFWVFWVLLIPFIVLIVILIIVFIVAAS